MKLLSTAYTHVGRRSNNEDAHCAEPHAGLFAVADGMGGYEGGEIASNIAIETITEFVHRNLADEDTTWPYPIDHDLSLDENMVAIGARMAHERIAVRRIGPLARMGSTLATMVVRGDVGVVCHIGDSRVYRYRGGHLCRLTRDHSLYEELFACAGGDMPTREEFQHTNVITRALGIDGAPEVRTVRLRAGDLYLLCTDGLTEVVAEDRIAAVLRGYGLDDACRALVTEAYALGGRDNITAVLVRCV